MATNDDMQIRNFVLKFEDTAETKIHDVETRDFSDRFDFELDFGGDDYGF